MRDKYRQVENQNKKFVDLFYFVRPSLLAAAFLCSTLVMMTSIYFTASTKLTDFYKFVGIHIPFRITILANVNTLLLHLVSPVF